MAQSHDAGYAEEARRLEALLPGIQVDELSACGRGSLDTLATLADVLELGDTRQSGYLMAMNDVFEEAVSVEAARESVRDKTAALSAKVQHAIREEPLLENALEAEQQQARVDRGAEVAMLLQKQRKYGQAEAKHDKALKKSKMLSLQERGVDIRHGSIQAVRDDIQALAEENAKLEKQLQALEVLPADHALAAQMEAAARTELQRLSEQLDAMMQEEVDGMGGF